MTHTPGEWTANLDKHDSSLGYPVTGNGRSIATVYLNETDTRWTQEEENAHNTEARANARLIAGAPDLLAALKALEAEQPHSPFDGQPDFEEKVKAANPKLYAVRKQAQAAIAKATE